ncbi:MAG: prephenate dehydratase [Saprospiraceae bacterium]
MYQNTATLEVTSENSESEYCRKSVAIQGIEGSFHHIAAANYFGNDIDLVPCNRFEKIFKNLDNKVANKAVIAIENSVAGTILPNYALLRNGNYKIVGELSLRIQHQLLIAEVSGQGNQSIEDIKIVKSHPMALLQCQEFFKKHPHIHLEESDDTAAAAKRLAQTPEAGIAVIASEKAGEIFGLKTIAKNIEDNKRNFTRFLVLDADNNVHTENNSVNKASICFHVGHQVGALAKVLTALASENINLVKIQSLPLVGREWEYFFHVDMEFFYYENYKNGLKKIEPYTKDLKILGQYQRGKTVD